MRPCPSCRQTADDCSYPGEAKPGCLRDKRLRDEANARLARIPARDLGLGLIVDPERLEHGPGESTDIFVRAYLNGTMGEYDIASLEKASLLRWLRANKARPEAVVLMLLGHRQDPIE